MKKITQLLILAMVLFYGFPVFAAGTCGAPTPDEYTSKNGVIFQTYTWDFTSDAAGDADCTAQIITGYVVDVETDPGAAAPTADWNLELLRNGGDIMGGATLDRHTSTTENAAPLRSSIPYPALCTNDTITPDITDAGNAKTGSFTVFVQP